MRWQLPLRHFSLSLLFKFCIQYNSYFVLRENGEKMESYRACSAVWRAITTIFPRTRNDKTGSTQKTKYKKVFLRHGAGTGLYPYICRLVSLRKRAWGNFPFPSRCERRLPVNWTRAENIRVWPPFPLRTQIGNGKYSRSRPVHLSFPVIYASTQKIFPYISVLSRKRSKKNP